VHDRRSKPSSKNCVLLRLTYSRASKVYGIDGTNGGLILDEETRFRPRSVSRPSPSSRSRSSGATLPTRGSLEVVREDSNVGLGVVAFSSWTAAISALAGNRHLPRACPTNAAFSWPRHFS